MGTSSPPDDRAVVLWQLERILSSPAFRNSKRYPKLLRHIVEKTLEGEAGELKERTLGVEVFGRPADYDTNIDPIVRVTAGEVRNRIARYYHEPGHESELRIDLPAGSYVAEFHSPAAGDGSALAPEPTKAVIPRPRPGTTLSVAVAGVVLAAAVMTGIALWRPWAHPNPFWRPFLDAGAPVTICLARAPNSSAVAGRPVDIGWPDVFAAVKISSALGGLGARDQLRRGDDVTFEDLRRAPAVLVGAFNDVWTLRLMESLRFEPQQEGNRRWVLDHRNPGERKWSVELSTPGTYRDYAIISRLVASRTDKPLLMLAGLRGHGTEVAGDFIADASLLERLAKEAPAGWENRNLQVVIETEVIDDHAGPPRIVAVHVW